MQSRHGFTLVELSIVLVITGLLVGGVLVGQELIHAAQLRSITTEYSRYDTAIGAFKSKYNALPGDMKNATRFWGASDPDPHTCSITPSTDTSTCDGNGNGLVQGAGDAVEQLYFWQHLSNAELIEGRYSGTGIDGDNTVFGYSVPTSKYAGGGWSIAGWTAASVGAAIYNANYNSDLAFGGEGDDAAFGPILTPVDAYSLDDKIDDGKPGEGAVVSYKRGASWTPNCVTLDETAYDTSNSEVLCALTFITGY